MDPQAAFSFLVETLFSLYLMVVLLRVWMQMARADFYNPLSQFVVKATHPIVGPLRRFIPPIGNLDTATLLFAFVLSAIKIAILLLLMGRQPGADVLILGAGFTLLKEIINMLFWVLIIRALLSWVSQGGYNPIESLLHQLTEPMLAPIRRILPPMGGLDLSVMVVILAIMFLRSLFPFL